MSYRHNPLMEPEFFTPPDGSSKQLHKGGGGGGSAYYGNLDNLYAAQTRAADRLQATAETTVLPGYEQFVEDSASYGSQENQERAAQRAGADAAAARGIARRDLADNLASMGVNPSDMRYANMMRDMDLQAAGQQAAAMTGARDRTRDMGFARRQDALGMGMGVPSQASSAFNSAGNSAYMSGNLRNQSAQLDYQNSAGMARGAMNAYQIMTAADGGYAHNYAQGGYVSRYANGGGVIGAMGGGRPVMPPPSAPSVPQQRGMGAATGSAVGTGVAATGKLAANGAPTLGRGIQAAGQQMGSADTVAAGNQVSIGANADPAVKQFVSDPEGTGQMYQMQKMATQQVDSQLPAVANSNAAASTGTGGVTSAPATGTAEIASGAGEVAGTSSGGALATGATDAALTTGATAAAGETAGAVGGSALGAGAGAALGAISTVAPYVGAAIALGSALGWFADGGQATRGITPGAHGAKGGEVDGPGGPKDDLIPAMLSDGEFVLPIGTVKKYGLAKLEKMRQEGLEFERQLGIRRAA